MMFTAATVTTCGIHQLDVVKVSDAALSVVSPSFCVAMVTLPVGAEVRRTV